MSKNNKVIGSFGEKIACLYLENKNHKILIKNFKCKFGEIDLITNYNNNLFFIEVKTRHNINFGLPFESVNSAKLKKIKKISQCFLLRNNYFLQNDINLRYCVVSIIIYKELMDAILIAKENNPINLKNIQEGIDYKIKMLEIS